MKYLARLCVCALTAVVLFAGLSRVIGAWFGQEMSALQLSRALVFESRRTEALRHRSEAVARSLAVKQEVVAEVLAGRLKLRDSALQFQAANELIDKDDADLLPDYSVPDSNEAVCEQVLTWVRSEVFFHASDAANRIVKDMENEFQAMFGRPCLDTATPEDPLRYEASVPSVAD